MALANQMLLEKGLVTKVSDGFAWVNTQSQLACSSCKVESTCGNGILEKYLAGKIFISKVENTLGAHVGEQVELAIPKSRVTQASLLVYMVPLIGLIAGAIVGQVIYNNEVLSIVLSSLGLFAGFLLVKIFSQTMLSGVDFVPRMINKIPTNYSKSEFESLKVVNL